MTDHMTIERFAWAQGRGDRFCLRAREPGPALMVTGAVHGDETCGADAIRRVVDEFRSGQLSLQRGSITFIPVSNVVGYQAGQRFVEHDLNRELRHRDNPTCKEQEIQNEMLEVMTGHDVLLDIHSFKGEGQPFIFLGPENNSGEIEPFDKAEQELAFASVLGADTYVYGWLTAYDGFIRQQNELMDALPDGVDAAPRAHLSLGCGMVENFRMKGGYGVTIECGNHHDPEAPGVAYRAIRNALVHLGLVRGEVPAGGFSRGFHLTDVLLKQHGDDALARDWKIFDPVKADDVLGHRADGQAVTARQDGAVIFTYPASKAGGPFLYLAVVSKRGLGD